MYARNVPLVTTLVLILKAPHLLIVCNTNRPECDGLWELRKNSARELIFAPEWDGPPPTPEGSTWASLEHLFRATSGESISAREAP